MFPRTFFPPSYFPPRYFCETGAPPGGLRAALERTLARRVGKDTLEAVGFSPCATGSNGDMADPIGTAMRHLGYGVSAWDDVTDGDLAAVDGDDVERLAEFAELRLMESVKTAAQRLVDLQTGQNQFRLSQVARGLEATLPRRWEDYKERWEAGRERTEIDAIGSDYRLPSALELPPAPSSAPRVAPGVFYPPYWPGY